MKNRLVFTFGRFNPPTTGHEKLLNKVAEVAGDDDYLIFPSRLTLRSIWFMSDEVKQQGGQGQLRERSTTGNNVL